MPDQRETERDAGRLPAKWELVVQLVGTFGLAVFLVLYYVLVMQPRERERYEELQRSVETVIRMVEAGQTPVTREQSERLKELFISSAASELARHLDAVLSAGEPLRPVPVADARRLTEKLRDELEELLVAKTRFLHGLVRQSGDDMSQSLVMRIRRSEVSDRLAARVVREWPYRGRSDLVDVCEASLHVSFRVLPSPD